MLCIIFNSVDVIVDDFDTSIIQHFNTSTLQHFDTSTLRHFTYFNTSTLQHFGTSTLQHFDTSTLRHFDTSTPQHFNTSTLQHALYGRGCRCDATRRVLLPPDVTKSSPSIFTPENIGTTTTACGSTRTPKTCLSLYTLIR